LTNIRTNRKNRLRPLWDKLLLRTRARIDTRNDQWQHLSPMEHTQPRRVTGCMVNLVAGLVASGYQPKKPSLARLYPFDD
jgi:hypothetical protein